MIACSYCGRENDDAAAQCCGCGTELRKALVKDIPSKTRCEIPPQLPQQHLIDPAALEKAFNYKDGFHRPDWDFISQWIDSHILPPDLENAWNEVVLLWAKKIRDDLGGDYFVLQSPEAVLLCNLPLETAHSLLAYIERAISMIKQQLGDVAWQDALGKHVVFIFSDHDDYYQYLAFHSREGKQAASGGACIYEGYTHIIVPWQDEFNTANDIIHELVHNCLAHLPLPLWLNEGVALTLERAIGPLRRAPGEGEQSAFFAAAINWRPPIMWDELAERHFAFWNEQNIQSFWAGTSFYQPGDPNELSYSLAEVLVKLLLERGNAAAFSAFLEAADWADAGQTAALDILGVDLGEIAGTFLGAGNWRPCREALAACWKEIGWEEPSTDEKASLDRE